ncbi:MAG TPA: VOC family protein [Candidatus Acidoferrales bacterium]|nr:VOC family protein [Candidatus Acidoferrales bacterium]
MAKQNLNEQLDRAIDAILARRDSKGRDSKKDARAQAKDDSTLASLSRVAADLRDLPSDNFKTSLKADLIRRANMSSKPVAITESHQTATPYLCFKNSAAAIEFYTKAFGATETYRLAEPGGRIGHAELQIGNSRIMISDEFPDFGALSAETLGGSPMRIQLLVADVDAFVRQAIAAGAALVRPVQDQFYGYRAGQITDPFGYRWGVSTFKETVSPEEMQRRYDEMMKQPSEGAAEEKPSGQGKPSAQAKPGKQTKGASNAVPFIREGFHSVTPYILVGGAAKFIDFLKEAFGAEERGRVPTPDGKIMHAEVQLGDSVIEMSDGNEQYAPSPVTIHLTVPDAEEAYRNALQAGATSLYEPSMQFYGEYEAGVRDPFGNEWYITPQAKKHPHPSVQPYLHLHGAEKMIQFLEEAFSAKAEGVHKWPGGAIAHATVFIGDGQIEIDEAFRANRQTQCHLHLYVPDTDAVYGQALRAGAASIEAPNDKPYGDRSAGVKDAWGNSWFIATHIKDVAF